MRREFDKFARICNEQVECLRNMSCERRFKSFCVAGSLLGLIVLAALIPHLTLAKVPELCLFGLFFLSAGLSMTPIPKSRLYFMFGAPFAVLSILILKELTVFPFVIAYFLSALYKSKTSRRTPLYITLWNALRFAPILWASYVAYDKLGGTDFHALSEFQAIPFIGMAIVFEALRLFSFNAALAMHLGKSPWRLIVPASAEIDLLFIPIAIPMYLFYQSAGVIGLLLLLLPVTIVLVFIKYLVEQAYKKQEALDAFTVVSELIDARLSLRTFADRIFDKLTAILEPQVVELFTRNSLGQWNLEAYKGNSPWTSGAPSSTFFKQISGLFSTEPTLLHDVERNLNFASYSASGLASLVVIPLYSEERNLGFVLCAHKIPRFFHEGHMELAKMLAGRLSSALVSAQLHEHLEATLKELRETQAQLVQTEKLVGISRLVAGVAHELNNPLNLLTLQLPLLRSDVEKLLDTVERQVNTARMSEEDQFQLAHRKEKLALQETRGRITKSFAALHEGMYRSKTIVDNLRAFARTETLGENWDYVDINEAIESTLLFLTPLYEGRITIRKNYQEAPKVWANAARMSEVFMNLFSNAFDAIEGKGEVWVKTSNTNGKFEVAITDSGPGISEANQRRVFEPFFTTKEVGKGTGLGLSIVYGIVKQHHGEIRVESQEGLGSTFKVILPVAAAVLA